MHLPVLIPFWGTGKTKYALKFDNSNLLTRMTNYYTLDVQCLHCVRDKDFIACLLQNNLLEAFRTGVRGN